MDDLTKPTGNSLVERVKAILLKPKDEWPKIAAEPATPGGLITGYALPLLAIGPIASFLGGQLFGYGAFGFSYRPGFVAGLTGAITGFVVGLIGIVVLALIADFLAPKFGGESNRANAFKLVVYGATAGWVAGIFGLIPALGFLGLLGLYSLYLIYTGATPVMKVPEDKAAGYTAVTILCAIVLYIVVGLVTASVTGLFGGAASLSSAGAGGQLTVPGMGTIDTAKIEDAGKQMEAIGSGKVPVVAGSAMQALLPAAIGGYQRTAVETNAVGRMGSQAEGTYTAGDKSFRLKVTDMAALGALAGLGAAMGVEQSREDANGYERTTTVDGQIQTEEWNKTDSRGKFGTTIGNRFMVEAEGQAGSIDELKAAVATIDPGALAGLAE
ncbi:MAG TPA: Yip1 family protein [Novosphingobium sp.]|nr:Yip1 family protein [Novosphingobium sp.]